MELKINFDEAKLQEETLRATLLKGVVDHLLASLTPEALAVFLEKMLAEALKGISSYQITDAMRPHFKAIVDAYVATPEVTSRINEAIHAGVDSAIGDYPATIRGAVFDMAKKSMLDSLTSKLRYG